MNWFRKLLAFFGIHKAVRWEDGVIVRGAIYARLYAETVAWVRANAPQVPIQAPDLVATIRIYKQWPVNDGLTHYGKVLAPNTIPGDTGGTLCLLRQTRHDMALIVHECKHAVTGIPSHPAWLFN